MNQYKETVIIDLEIISWNIRELIGKKFIFKETKHGVEVMIRGKIIFDFDKETRKYVLEPHK